MIEQRLVSKNGCSLNQYFKNLRISSTLSVLFILVVGSAYLYGCTINSNKTLSLKPSVLIDKICYDDSKYDISYIWLKEIGEGDYKQRSVQLGVIYDLEVCVPKIIKVGSNRFDISLQMKSSSPTVDVIQLIEKKNYRNTELRQFKQVKLFNSLETNGTMINIIVESNQSIALKFVPLNSESDMFTILIEI